MKRLPMTRYAIVALALLAVTTAGVRAADPTPGPVRVSDAWANPATAGGSVQMFGSIANSGDESDRLIGAMSPSAASGELHDAAKGAAPVTAIVVPAHGLVPLALAGNYVAFTGLKSDIAAGSLFFARLHFERAGWVVAIVHVRGGNAPAITSPSGAAPVPASSSLPVIPVPVIQH